MIQSERAMLWRRRMQRLAASQMTVTEFCRSEGIAQSSFYKWKKKLAELPGDVVAKTPVTSVQFVPVRLAKASGDQATALGNRATGLGDRVGSDLSEQADGAMACATIELPGGVRIRVEVPAARQPARTTAIGGEQPEART